MPLEPIAEHTHLPNWSRRYPKAHLARHLTTPHAQPDGTVMRLSMPASEIARWSIDELDRAHHELHKGEVRHEP